MPVRRERPAQRTPQPPGAASHDDFHDRPAWRYLTWIPVTPAGPRDARSHAGGRGQGNASLSDGDHVRVALPRRNLVAKSAYRDDGRRRHRRRVELHPQTADVHVDGAAAAGVLVAPHELREFISSEHLVRAAGQRSQQAILGRRELQLVTAERDATPKAIDDQLADSIMVRLRSGLDGLAL